MNFGACPYCDKFMGLLRVPEITPAYAKVKCQSCGRDVWYRFSRIDPEAWRVEDFERVYAVGKLAHDVVRKHGKESGE